MTTYSPGRLLPNIDSIVGSSLQPAHRVMAEAKGNPTLAEALAQIEALQTAERGLDGLRNLIESWRGDAVAVEEEAEAALLQGVTTGTTSEAMMAIEKLHLRSQARDLSIDVVDRLAHRFVDDGARSVHESANDLLAHVGARLKIAMDELAEHASHLDRFTTADEALRTGRGESWAAREVARESVVEARGAQRVVVRYLVPDVYEWAKSDERRWVAVCELADWRSVEVRLPLILRHGGVWTDEGAGQGGSYLAEPLEVPWPQDVTERAEWLACEHPDVSAVPTVEQIRQRQGYLERLMMWVKATGEQQEAAEPRNAFGRNPFVDKRAKGALR